MKKISNWKNEEGFTYSVQLLVENIAAALSMLYVLGLLLCFADAQKLSSGEGGSVATTSAFWLKP